MGHPLEQKRRSPLESEEEQEKFRAKASLFLNQDPAKWPKLLFNWDTTEAGQIYSLDNGTHHGNFYDYYPNGFILGVIPLVEFDSYLCHYSRRDGNELWKLGNPHDLAYLIAYLAEGKPISPPLVKPTDNREVILLGGHHRYAAAKAVNLESVLLYSLPEHIDALNSFMNIQWSKT